MVAAEGQASWLARAVVAIAATLTFVGSLAVFSSVVFYLHRLPPRGAGVPRNPTTELWLDAVEVVLALAALLLPTWGLKRAWRGARNISPAAIAISVVCGFVLYAFLNTSISARYWRMVLHAHGLTWEVNLFEWVAFVGVAVASAFVGTMWIPKWTGPGSREARGRPTSG